MKNTHTADEPLRTYFSFPLYRSSCYVPYIGSELQVLLPLPQVLGLKAQVESTTPWLTVKRQTEMNLGIPGKKGSWFQQKPPSAH